MDKHKIVDRIRKLLALAGHAGTQHGAAARPSGCRQCWRGASIRLFGRQSAVQAASYTCQYLWTEVDRLAAVAVRAADVEAADYYCNGRWTEKPATRAWKN